MPAIRPPTHEVTLALRCAAGFAVVLLAGCAPGVRQPTLIYPPAQTSTTAAARPDTAAAPKNKQIILNPFIDQRADKQVVGRAPGAFSSRTEDVIPANSVPEWVVHAIKTELQNNGYVVTLGSAAGDNLPGASAVVSGEIRGVYCEFRNAGKVSLLGRMKKAGRDVLHKSYAGEGPASPACGRTAESYAQSLALALASAARQFAAEIDTTLTMP